MRCDCRSGAPAVMLLMEDAWTSWEAVDATVVRDMDVAGRAYVVDGVAAMGYAAGQLAGIYVVTECGGVAWAREPVTGWHQPEWLRTQSSAPSAAAVDLRHGHNVQGYGGASTDDIDTSAEGTKRLCVPAAQGLWHS